LSAGYLIDSDVLIGYLRGEEKAVRFLESLEIRPATSVICVAELLAGARNDREQAVIESFLLAFDLLDVDVEIARLAGGYRRAYSKSHGTGLADALIAATSSTRDLALVSFNHRHFPMVSEFISPN
jgi:predicted nucleic acid-binding protein